MIVSVCMTMLPKESLKDYINEFQALDDVLGFVVVGKSERVQGVHMIWTTEVTRESQSVGGIQLVQDIQGWQRPIDLLHVA